MGRLMHDGRSDLLDGRGVRREIAAIDDASLQGLVVMRSPARDDIDPDALQLARDPGMVDRIALADQLQRLDDTSAARVRLVFRTADPYTVDGFTDGHAEEQPRADIRLRQRSSGIRSGPGLRPTHPRSLLQALTLHWASGHISFEPNRIL